MPEYQVVFTIEYQIGAQAAGEREALLEAGPIWEEVKEKLQEYGMLLRWSVSHVQEEPHG